LIGLLIFLAASAANGREAPRCALPGGDLVPSAQVAREIAEAVIRGRQTDKERSEFQLMVEPAGNDAWDVMQVIPDRIEADGTVTVTNGGGLAIRIARCNGAILFVHYVI
jgi:hypothetical protein